MIFIINETNEQLKLKTASLEGATTLELQVGEAMEGTIATTDSKDVATVITTRFSSEGEVIKNKISKHNFILDTARIYLDNSEDGSVKLVAINVDNELPERYRYAKDMIVVVHSSNDIVSMRDDSLNGSVKVVESEQGDYRITIFAIKWYNWSKLSTPVSVNINDTAVYSLAALPSKKVAERLVNSVVSHRKNNKKKRNNNK